MASGALWTVRPVASYVWLPNLRGPVCVAVKRVVNHTLLGSYLSTLKSYAAGKGSRVLGLASNLSTRRSYAAAQGSRVLGLASKLSTRKSYAAGQARPPVRAPSATSARIAPFILADELASTAQRLTGGIVPGQRNAEGSESR